MERTREIGILKAVEAKSRTVLIMFLVEAALIGIVGSLIGGANGVQTFLCFKLCLFGFWKSTAKPRVSKAGSATCHYCPCLFVALDNRRRNFWNSHLHPLWPVPGKKSCKTRSRGSITIRIIKKYVPAPKTIN
jgi:hypothetical protein